MIQDEDRYTKKIRAQVILVLKESTEYNHYYVESYLGYNFIYCVPM